MKLESRLSRIEQSARAVSPAGFAVVRCPLNAPWHDLSPVEQVRRITAALGRPELPGDTIMIVSVRPPGTRRPVA
jgi:hypothetical protein